MRHKVVFHLSLHCLLLKMEKNLQWQQYIILLKFDLCLLKFHTYCDNMYGIPQRVISISFEKVPQWTISISFEKIFANRFVCYFQPLKTHYQATESSLKANTPPSDKTVQIRNTQAQSVECKTRNQEFGNLIPHVLEQNTLIFIAWYWLNLGKYHNMTEKLLIGKYGINSNKYNRSIRNTG